MKKVLYTIGLFLTGAALLSSCMEDPGTTIKYGGKRALVLFERAVFSSELSKLYIKKNDAQPIKDSIEVNIIPPSTGITSTDIEVNYEITPIAGTNGTEFSATSGSVTIPAGKFSAKIPFMILDDNILSDTDVYSFAVKLTTANNAEVRKGYDSLVVKFSISCPSAIDDFLENEVSATYHCFESSTAFGNFDYDVTFTKTGEFEIRNENFYDSGLKLKYQIVGCDYENLSVTASRQQITSGGFTAEASGTANVNTKTINTTYTIYRPSGSVYDEGTHDYIFVSAPAPVQANPGQTAKSISKKKRLE